MRSVLRIIAIALAIFAVHSQAQIKNKTDGPDKIHRDWQASWVTHPTAPLREPVVLHFRGRWRWGRFRPVIRCG